MPGSAVDQANRVADYSAIWETSDPQMVMVDVHDVAAPLDWTFERYNAADEEIRALTADKGARSITVPCRANRAAIFDSDLFHETDTISFKPGYDERRINVTLLFGRREDAGARA